MARFNKTAHLRQNIDAIKAAFTLDREKREASPEEKEILQAYSGFGAIKEVIDPLPKDGGKTTPLTPLIEELHTVLKENTANEKEYKQYLNGIKDSILSAFYTPPVIADTLIASLIQSGVTPLGNRPQRRSRHICRQSSEIRSRCRNNLFRKRPDDGYDT